MHRLLVHVAALSFALLSTGCGGSEIDDFIDLVIENRTGSQIWIFSYADCGSDEYTGVIADDEYLADGDDLSAVNLEPGCYDLYVEDELGCFSENSTDGNVAGGIAFTWTVRQSDLTCP